MKNMLPLLLFVGASTAAPAPAPAPAPPKYEYPPGGACSDVALCIAHPTNDHAVLQRAPAHAAVTGSVPAAFRPKGAAAVVTLVLTQLDPAPATNKTYTALINPDNTWKVVLDAHPTGGNFSLVATCSSGCVDTGPTNNTAAAVDLTFGDVYLCTGQSNMWLPLGNTFSRNLSYAKVQSGHYSNIRINNGQLNFPFDTPREDIWVTGGRWAGQWNQGPSDLSPGQWRHPSALSKPAWDTVYSTCWYTAEALTELFLARKEVPPPLGMIEMSVGGTKLSQWVEREAAAVCLNATCCCQYDCQPEHCPNAYLPVAGDSSNTSGHSTCVGNGQMYNALVRPVLNTTIKGVLWYQVRHTPPASHRQPLVAPPPPATSMIN